MARRSASVKLSQPAISASVLPHPAQSPLARSITQSLMQGVITAAIRSIERHDANEERGCGDLLAGAEGIAGAAPDSLRRDAGEGVGRGRRE